MATKQRNALCSLLCVRQRFGRDRDKLERLFSLGSSDYHLPWASVIYFVAEDGIDKQSYPGPYLLRELILDTDRK
jgi:hypothetical protein